MKLLKKISLANQIPDDVKVAILNDSEKRRLFQKNTSSKTFPSGGLVNRLWLGLEHMTKFQRQKAIKVIEVLESSPSFNVNEKLEVVYNGDVVGGTNILQLIKARVTPSQGGRVLLPGQELFDHILSTAPLANEAPKIKATPKRKAQKRFQNFSPLSPRKTRKARKEVFKESQWIK